MTRKFILIITFKNFNSKKDSVCNLAYKCYYTLVRAADLSTPWYANLHPR